MRPGTDTQLLDALEAPSIVTALMCRLDLANGPAFLWTGSEPIMVTGSGDSLLDNNVFDPLVHGVALQIGDNAFSYTGSEALTISLAIPSDVSEEISIASVYPEEWRTRPATFWRAIMVKTGDPLAEPGWIFRRVRVGAMDKLEIQNDGRSRTFNLTIEGHASLISTATGATYLDQKRFDPTDTSQDFAVSIANGDPAPSKPPSGWAGMVLHVNNARAAAEWKKFGGG